MAAIQEILEKTKRKPKEKKTSHSVKSNVRGETMTIEEIERLYDKEWILIKDPVRSRDQKLKKGHVLCLSNDRDEIYDRIPDFGPMHFSVMYVGKRPAGVVYVL